MVMSALPSTSHDLIDGMTIGIAVVTRDSRRGPVVSACNDVFLAMMDDGRTHPRSFPVPLETSMRDSVEKMLAADGVLSVFILDIDYFKKINDSYGHDIGDEVLRVLADVGMTIPFESKLFARWGGEEFVGALPGADASVAFRIADALRKRCEQQESEHVWRTKPIAFTVSIGVVTREAGERDVDALMRRADRALYRAKETGRNRVAVG